MEGCIGEASPRPWHIGESISGTMSCIYDANGEHIASCFGMPTEADAAFIVAAVNKHGMPIVELIKAYDALEAERDRLRDIVRRLLAIAEPAVSELKEFDAAVLSVGGARVLPVAEKEAVVREARNAI